MVGGDGLLHSGGGDSCSAEGFGFRIQGLRLGFRSST